MVKHLFILMLVMPCWAQLDTLPPGLLSHRKSAASSGPSPTLAWYKYDEGGAATTTADATANGNTGTLSGSTKPSWITGPNANSALSFNGSTAFVDNGAGSETIFNGASTLTFSFWANNAHPGAETILGENPSGSTAGIIIEFNSTTTPAYSTTSGQLYFYYVDATGKYDSAYLSSTNAAMNDGTWHFYTITYNNTTETVQMYIDAVSQSVTYGHQYGPATIGSLAADVYVGALDQQGTGYEYGYYGSLDDVRIYNTVVASTDITTLYNAKAQ